MIPSKTDIKTQGNMMGEKVNLSFDETATAHLLGVLTDLYSDPEMAIIREYSTNARDSHIAAGNADVPIEITTPSAFSPTFKVRDYGVGLSKQDVFEIYSKYGASTKRTTNDLSGVLGLGCKSALTYADQFIVTAVKDGKRIAVSITRDSTSGSMTIIDEQDTNEPNGVEVSIPISQSDIFEQKVKTFFQMWEPGTVLVNGQEPDWIKPKLIHITGNIYYFHDTKTPMPYESSNQYLYSRNDYIVMGGCPYPCFITSYNSGAYDNGRIIYYADIGEVDFVPSREKLLENTRTDDVRYRIQKEFNSHLLDAFKAEIEAAPTFSEALKKANIAFSLSPTNEASYEYRGYKITPQMFREVFADIVEVNGRGSKLDLTFEGVPSSHLEKSVIINKCDLKQFSKTQRDRATQYFGETKYFIITPEEIDSPFVKGIATWEDIKNNTKPEKMTSSATIPSSWRVITNNNECEAYCTSLEIKEKSSNVFYNHRYDSLY